MKPKAVPGSAVGLGAILAALVIVTQAITACSTNDQERFRGRTTDQVKQACDPQRQTPEECSRGCGQGQARRPVYPWAAFLLSGGR
jgi:hypothetical protein